MRNIYKQLSILTLKIYINVFRHNYIFWQWVWTICQKKIIIIKLSREPTQQSAKWDVRNGEISKFSMIHKCLGQELSCHLQVLKIENKVSICSWGKENETWPDWTIGYYQMILWKDMNNSVSSSYKRFTNDEKSDEEYSSVPWVIGRKCWGDWKWCQMWKYLFCYYFITYCFHVII